MNRVLVLTLIALFMGSCIRDRQQREWQYMPDMYRSPALKAQEDNPDSSGFSYMRQPVVGTVPLDFVPYTIEPADTLAAAALENPLPLNEEVMAVGKKYFNIYCIVCHGAKGKGDGYIIPKMPPPPPLYSEKVSNWSDGRIFHTITNGQGNMPSYKSSIDQDTRWAIIHYVRALQRAANPTAEDVASFEHNSLTTQLP